VDDVDDTFIILSNTIALGFLLLDLTPALTSTIVRLPPTHQWWSDNTGDRFPIRPSKNLPRSPQLLQIANIESIYKFVASIARIYYFFNVSHVSHVSR
jgi:hypothetical protein